ncbi:MAG: class II fumarate hydratase [Candidatus Sericytochromatia bacterium]|uniref:Fumarate hydratase class II n=1 Tax=Candidatus Tanganyikabacteria bacterium TaxID=2961651 RepID=A0A937X4I0_9BACT|nr:class II fumarate hydratase [Candidatus Tanganyikabacteria bacterium]
MATTAELPTRTESDSMGEMQVPADAYYGASTARAVDNFPISGIPLPRRLIRALGLVKLAAAKANAQLGILDGRISDAVASAAQEVVEGKLDRHFPVDVYQTGSGTSSNMNANEVIANRATELLGGQRGSKLVHPNDHVNFGQSSNDVFPTAIHVAVLEALHQDLRPALLHLAAELDAKAKDWWEILKIGRTHLMDATPIRLGQEFGGYASQIHHAVNRLDRTRGALAELAIGGTAVGTGINTHPRFPGLVCERLSDLTGLEFREAENHFEAQGSRDALVEVSGQLRTIAVSLSKIANDVRWLASGPRCGIGEINLPAVQPGSSIMPGKVNPVVCESMIQVAAQVIGNDTAVTHGGLGGYFELNVMMPMMAHNLLESVRLLAAATRAFTDKAVVGLTPNADRCKDLIEGSLAMCTSLAPRIGYDKAARIAKHAFETKRTVREVAYEESGLSREEVDVLLDPAAMTAPDPDRLGSGGG